MGLTSLPAFVFFRLVGPVQLTTAKKASSKTGGGRKHGGFSKALPDGLGFQMQNAESMDEGCARPDDEFQNNYEVTEEQLDILLKEYLEKYKKLARAMHPHMSKAELTGFLRAKLPGKRELKAQLRRNIEMYGINGLYAEDDGDIYVDAHGHQRCSVYVIRFRVFFFSSFQCSSLKSAHDEE